MSADDSDDYMSEIDVSSLGDNAESMRMSYDRARAALSFAAI